MHQHIPLRDAYEIFKEKCLDEGINPPTFEIYKNRTLGQSHLDNKDIIPIKNHTE